MFSRCHVVVFAIALLATCRGAARAEDDARIRSNDLPESVLKSVRAADEADAAFRAAGSTVSDAVRQRARDARATARKDVSDYYMARAEYLRLAAETDNERKNADATTAHLLEVKNAIPPNPARTDKAQEDANYALQALAEAEIKLEHARSAVEQYWASTPMAGEPARPSSTGAAENRNRFNPPPPPPATPDRGGYENVPAAPRAPYYNQTAVSSTSMVYRGGLSTYELFDSYGTAMIWCDGHVRLVLLEFDHAGGPFWFYRPLNPDTCCSMFAFARTPECAGDCHCQMCKFAVWHKDNGCWQWEWTDGAEASGSCGATGPGVIRSAPMSQPIPQPVLFKPLVADDHVGPIRLW